MQEKKLVKDKDPLDLIAVAAQKGASIETLERLMSLRERIKQEQDEQLLREALAEFQGKCPVIKKNRIVLNKDNTIRYRYATLDEIVKVAAPILSECGLSVHIDTEIAEKMLTAVVTVWHVNGACTKSRFTVPIDVNSYMTDAQKWASALTYAKRYAYCNALGILTGDEDDDNVIALADNVYLHDITKNNEYQNDITKNNEYQNDITKSDEYQKLKALPETIRKRLKDLGFNARQAIDLCVRAKWDTINIIAEVTYLEQNKVAGNG